MAERNARSLGKQRVKRDGKCAMPDPLTIDQVERLLKIGHEHGFTLDELLYGALRTRMWWTTRRKMRTDWPMVIINSMHSGWGLKGFGEWKTRGMNQRKLRSLGLYPSLPEGIRQDREGRIIADRVLRVTVLERMRRTDGQLEKPGTP